MEKNVDDWDVTISDIDGIVRSTSKHLQAYRSPRVFAIF